MKLQRRTSVINTAGTTPDSRGQMASLSASQIAEFRRRARFQTVAAIAAATAISGMGLSTSRAASTNYTLVSGSTNWSAAASWTPSGGPPGTTSINDTATETASVSSSTGTWTLAGSMSIGSINFAISGTKNATLNAASGGPLTLTLNGGGAITPFIEQNSTNNLTIAAGTGATQLNLALGANGEFDIENSGNLTVSSVISGAYALTISNTTGNGSGKATFSGTNTFTGGLLITGAELDVTADGNLGGTSGSFGAVNGSVTVNGGRLQFGSNMTVNSSRNIYLGANATGSSSAGTLDVGTGFTTVYNGVLQNLSGSTGNFVENGGGTLQLGGVATYSGATFINNGIVQLATGGALPAGTVLNVGQSASTNLGTFDIHGINQTIAGLTSATGTNALSSTNVVTSSAGTPTLTINTAPSTSYTYGLASGTTAQMEADSGVISGSLSLIKSGTGTQILGGANTYTGTTAVNAGQLVITGSLAAGNVTVGGNGTAATLSGSGTIGGALTVKNLGVLTAGVSNVGNLTVTGLIFGSSGSDSETVNVTPGSGGAYIVDSGSLTIAGGTGIAVNIGGSAQSTGTYPLISYTGTQLSSGAFGEFAALTAANLPNRETAHLSNDSGALDLVVTGVDYPVWNNGAGNNKWDTGTSNTNWYSHTFGTGTALYYEAGDTVLFDDTVGSNANAAVNIDAGNVSPASVTFNNSTYNYVVGSTASNFISGSTSLIKNGTASVTLNTSNTYTGGTTLNAGTLVAGNATAFGGAASTLTINGGSLDSGVANLVMTANNPQIWNSDFTFAGTNNLNLGTGTVSLGINAGATRTVTVTSGTLTVGGVISSGTNGTTPTINLTKAGSGNLLLTGANTYTGTTAISAGTLTLGQTSGSPNLSAASGGGGFVGNLVVSDGIQVNFNSGTFSGGGQIQIQTTGATLTNTSGVAGTIGNAIVLNSTNSSGAGFTGGNVAASTYAVGSFVTTLGGTGGSSPAITFSGGISGYSDVNIANSPSTGGGSGPIDLGGTNTYKGATTINTNASVITLENANVFPTGTDVIVGTETGIGTTTLNLNGFSQQIGSISDGANVTATAHTVTLINNGSSSPASLTIGDAISPANGFSGPIKDGTSTIGLVKIGTDTISLTGTNNAFSGGVTVNQGTLIATGAGALGTGFVTVDPSGTAGTIADNATLSTHGSSIASGTALTVNTESGDVVGGIPYGVGTVDFTTAAPGIGSLSGNGNVVLGTGTGTTTLTVGYTNNLSSNFSGVISDAAAGEGILTKAGSGTLTLSGANTYSGMTQINAGTLTLAPTVASTNNIPNSSAIVVGSGATLNVAGLTSGALVLSSGQVLGGVGTISGATTVASGSTIAAGTSAALGTGTTDTVGTLNTGNVTMNSGSNYAWKLATTTGGAGTSWDVLNIVGTLNLNPGINLNITQLSTESGQSIGSAGGTSYVIATATSITGFSPSDFTITDLTGNATDNYSVQEVGGNELELTVTTPEPGSLGLLGLGAIGLLRRRRRGTVSTIT